MSVTSVLAQPSRRERLYYLLFAALVSTFLVMSGLSIWMLSASTTQQAPFVTVGSVDSFPPSDTPYKVTVDKHEAAPLLHHGGQSRIHGVWLTNIGGMLQAYAPIAKDSYGCPYAWNSVNMRFENPCSGSKYWLDGTVIALPATHDLDRYPVTIQEGLITIDTQILLLGGCRQLNDQYGYDAHTWDRKTPPPPCDQP